MKNFFYVHIRTFALTVVFSIFVTPFVFAQNEISVENKKVSIASQGTVLSRLFKVTDQIQLHVEGQLDFTGGPIFKGDTVVEGSLLMADVLREDLQKGKGFLSTQALIGKDNLELRLHGKISENGKVSAVMDFYENNKLSYLPVVIKNKELGKIQLRLSALQWTGYGIHLNEKIQDVQLEVSCMLEVDDPYFKSKNQSSWSEVGCHVGLNYSSLLKDWVISIELKPQQKIPGQRPEGLDFCQTDLRNEKQIITKLYRSYRDKGLEFPQMVPNANGKYFTFVASLNNPNQRSVLASLYFHPKMKRLQLPKAPLGLYASIPRNTIVSVCLNTLAGQSETNPAVVLDFFKIERRYWIAGPSEVDSGEVRVMWNPAMQLKDSVFSLFAELPFIGEIIEVIDAIASPVINIPSSVLQKFIPVSNVNRIVITNTAIHLRTDSILLKKIELSNLAQ